MVDTRPVLRRRRERAPVQRGVGLRDDRPRVRVVGGFTGEVAGVELGEGGVDVVQVEHDGSRDSSVGVDLDDVRDLVCNRFGVAARGSYTHKGESGPTSRYDAQHFIGDADLGDHLQIFDRGISTSVCIPAFTTRRRSSTETLSASISAMAFQSPVTKYRQIALVHLACRVFQPPPGRLSSSNRASAASRSASSKSSPRLMRSPSTVTRRRPATRRRSPLRHAMRHRGADRSEVGQPVHSFDVDADVWHKVPCGTDVCAQLTGRERLSLAGGRC